MAIDMSKHGVEAADKKIKQNEQNVLLREIFTPSLTTDAATLVPPLPTDAATLVNKPAFATPPNKVDDPENPVAADTDTSTPKQQANAELANKETTSSVHPSVKTLPGAMSKAGQGAGFLPKMYPSMASVSSLVSGDSESSRKRIMTLALSEAYVVLSNSRTYEKLDIILSSISENILNVTELYQDVVTESYTSIQNDYETYGSSVIPTITYKTVLQIGDPPVGLDTTIPDLYTQVYYSYDEDPNPGYTKWISSDESEYVFIARVLGERYYESIDEEILSLAVEKAVLALDPYVVLESMTISVFNDILASIDSDVNTKNKEKTLGKNSSGLNVSSLMQILMGAAGTRSSAQSSQQMARSGQVLDSSKMSALMTSHEDKVAKAAKISQLLINTFSGT